jgi:hypothetical protein
MNHLVADDHRIGTLRDVVTTAVAGWHHRIRNAARDAAIVQTHVEPAIERPARVRVGAHAACASPRRSVSASWNTAVRWIDDEPCPAVLAIEGVEDEMRRRPESARELRAAHAFDELLVALLDDRLQLLGRDISKRLARELRRPLHRRTGLIVV